MIGYEPGRQLELKEQHPIFLLGKSHKWRSLVGYSPWGRQESDMTERLALSLLVNQALRGGSGYGNQREIKGRLGVQRERDRKNGVSGGERPKKII